MHEVYEPGLSRQQKSQKIARLISDYEGSNKSRRAFCDALGIKKKDLDRWIYKKNKKNCNNPFISVKLIQDVKTDNNITISAYNKFSITVKDTFDVSAMKQILEIIGGLQC